MISTQFAIFKIHRDLARGTILRWLLTGVAIVAILLGPLFDETENVTLSVLIVVGTIWLILSFRSMRGTRLAAASSSLIAAGQFEQAERHIADVLGTFSIFRAAKLMCLHDLAMLRHAQNRWPESAMLCRALLSEQRNRQGNLNRASRLILAESLLEMGDLGGVHDSIARLYEQRLPLREALMLLGLQLDYLWRIGAWEQMLAGVKNKIEMSELLPPAQSARAQALLALAANKTARIELRDWLRGRVELLSDVHRLCADRPILCELWS